MHSIRRVKTAVVALWLILMGSTALVHAGSGVPNGDFQDGALGGVPSGWRVHSARESLQPQFTLVERFDRKLLEASGNGNSLCVGYVDTPAPIVLGKTYEFAVEFRTSPGVDPQENLLFQCYYPGRNDGIFTFAPTDDGWIRGSTKIAYPGEGAAEAQVRILFRFSAAGKAWVRGVSLQETDPVEARWVRFACTEGKTDRAKAEAILDAAGRAGADLVLLTEYLAGGLIEESLDGPSFRLMSAKAREHNMYVAGGIVHRDEARDLVFNTALLVDRRGELVGTYDKVHPYSPEVNEEGVSPGNRVPVFDCDFGRIGIMICYDSWFGDVAELLALKGAEVILFPAAGYYRSLMPARSADNQVRIVSSSWNSGHGIWDTAGREVTDQHADATGHMGPGTTYRDIELIEVGDIELLVADLDLNCSPLPHHNGGTMYSAPGGRRNRRDQVLHLEESIRRERQSWWRDPVREASWLKVIAQQRDSAGTVSEFALPLDPARTAVIVVDMWSQGCHGHFRPDGSFFGAVEGYHYQEWVTKEINETLAAARALGMQVIFSPAGQTGPYAEHPVRQRMMALPEHDRPWEGILSWNDEQKKIPYASYPDGYAYRYPQDPLRVERPGTASFGQNPNLVLVDGDVMTDSAEELWNLLQDRGITHLIYMGGSTNMCLAARPVGLLNMRQYGVEVLLDRNYAHLVHRIPHGWNGDRDNPQFGPQYTNERNSEQVITYFEQHICPTIDGMVLRQWANTVAGGYTAPLPQVQEAEPDPADIRISFQPQHMEIAPGYVIDCGWEYVKNPNGLTYGWSSNHVLHTHRQDYDTVRGAFAEVQEGARWEIEVANGTYQVTVGVGQRQAGKHSVNLEGQTLCREAAVQGLPREFTRTVQVNDGRLTLDAGETTGNKTAIAYMHIIRQ